MAVFRFLLSPFVSIVCTIIINLCLCPIRAIQNNNRNENIYFVLSKASGCHRFNTTADVYRCATGSGSRRGAYFCSKKWMTKQWNYIYHYLPQNPISKKTSTPITSARRFRTCGIKCHLDLWGQNRPPDGGGSLVSANNQNSSTSARVVNPHTRLLFSNPHTRQPI